MHKLSCLALGALGALSLAVAGARAAAPTTVGTLDDAGTTLTSHVLALTGTCPAGNVVAVYAEGGKAPSTISDTQGGTWTLSASVSQGGSGFYRHAYRVLAADMVAGVDTITINQGTASGVAAAAICFDGGTVEQSGTVASPTSNGTGQSVTTSTAITAVPQYIVAAVGAWHANVNITDANSPPWTQLALVGTSGVQGAILVSYKRVTTAGGTETFQTTSSVTAWGAGYVAVPEPAGPPPVIDSTSTLLTLGVGG